LAGSPVPLKHNVQFAKLRKPAYVVNAPTIRLPVPGLNLQFVVGTAMHAHMSVSLEHSLSGGAPFLGVQEAIALEAFLSTLSACRHFARWLDVLCLEAPQ